MRKIGNLNTSYNTINEHSRGRSEWEGEGTEILYIYYEKHSTHQEGMDQDSRSRRRPIRIGLSKDVGQREVDDE